MKRQEYKTNMIEIDLKKLGTPPYCELNARATVRPEHDGYIEIIIPIFEQYGIRVLKELELKRELLWCKGSGYEPGSIFKVPKRGIKMSEQEKAEQLKKHLYYEPDSGFCSNEEEDDYACPCDYTGEECIGNRQFCEECPILTDEWEEPQPEKNKDSAQNSG